MAMLGTFKALVSLKTITSVRNVMSKKILYSFSHANLTLRENTTLKIEEKIMWKNWMEAGIFTLDQLIDGGDIFLSYHVLRDKYCLSDVAPS